MPFMMLSTHSHVQVLLTLQVMSHIIEGVGINDFQRSQMQANITTFEDILGGCERLLCTPIPVSYTRHTSRFLLIWLTILPLGLYSKLGWATVPAVSFIALLLLGAFVFFSCAAFRPHKRAAVHLIRTAKHTVGQDIGQKQCWGLASRPHFHSRRSPYVMRFHTLFDP
jgi:hypothetical protein